MDFADDCKKFLLEKRETSPNPAQWDDCQTVQQMSVEEIASRFQTLMKGKLT